MVRAAAGKELAARAVVIVVAARAVAVRAAGAMAVAVWAVVKAVVGEGGGEDLRRGLVDALLVRELDDVVRRVGVLRLQHLGDLVAQVLVGQLQLLLRLDVDPRRVPLVGAGHDDLLRLVGGLGHRGRSHRGLGHRRLLRTLWRHADAPRSALASPETTVGLLFGRGGAIISGRYSGYRCSHLVEEDFHISQRAPPRETTAGRTDTPGSACACGALPCTRGCTGGAVPTWPA